MKKLIDFFAKALPLFALLGCSKTHYTEISNAAYLRVFNDFNYMLTAENKGEAAPVFTMLIEPQFDAGGVATGGETVADFLVTRDTYAPPYPSHVGTSTTMYNPEYPGKANVLVGPILNGFDLSSWAQVPSGRKRVIFYYRPMSEVPFLQLEPRLRKRVLVDTVLNLDAGEVYTLEVLQKDFETRETGLILRQEVFHKTPLADSLVYVNFYNYSAKGFWNADVGQKLLQRDMGLMQWGVRDEMNIYYTLYNGDGTSSSAWRDAAVPGHDRVYMTTMRRNTESSAVNPYYHFPLFADPATNDISTNLFERFYVIMPGMDADWLHWDEFSNYSYQFNTAETYGIITCYQNGEVRPSLETYGALLPNLLVNIHSGYYNPRSFATVNTIEIVNGNVYLTTVQRVFDPPKY